MVECLIDNRASLSTVCSQPPHSVLSAACRNGNLAVAACLINAEADVNLEIRGCTPLTEAIREPYRLGMFYMWSSNVLYSGRASPAFVNYLIQHGYHATTVRMDVDLQQIVCVMQSIRCRASPIRAIAC